MRVTRGVTDRQTTCEWTECEAGWRFFLWVQWRIDTEIGFSGSVRHWNVVDGKSSLSRK